tara:strand:- start:16 stop:759 length:744 start_codon:yes stop_codon:yes gene_type:complete
MRTYKVNKIEHTVFDDIDELPDNIHYLRDWREGQIGDWVQADDGCIIQILRKGNMMKAKGKNKQVSYIGTCTGTFPVTKSMKMDTSRRMNIYSFGGNLTPEEVVEARKDLNSKEKLFVLNLARGLDPKVAYMKAFPTNNPGYANVKAAQLIKTKRIDTAMKEELKPVCEELGIEPKTVLSAIKYVAQTAEKDADKLKALFKLSDILDLEDKTSTTVQQVSGAVFQGFSKEQLETVERKELADGNGRG